MDGDERILKRLKTNRDECVDAETSSDSCTDASSDSEESNLMNGTEFDTTSGDVSSSDGSAESGNLPAPLSGVLPLSLYSLDISDYCPPRQTDAATKYQLMLTRRPEKGYVFPTRQYIDKRKKDGVTNRRCNAEWFDLFDFLAYSRTREGLYCLCCVLFPSQASSGTRAKGLITIPYTHWKDAKRDIFSHSYLPYHLESKAKMDEFVEQMQNGVIPPVLTQLSSAPVSPEGDLEKNKQFLECILKAVEVCGRQGFLGSSHRHGPASNDLIKAILDVRIDSGDQALRDHQQLCQLTATYASKSCQNDLLECVKRHVQGRIIRQIKEQILGPLYGILLEELSGRGPGGAVGLILRYVHNDEPVERLVDFIGHEEICQHTLQYCVRERLTTLGLEVVKCGSQSYDSNLRLASSACLCASGESQKTVGKLFSHIPCFHSGHNILNTTLCKMCCVKEVHFVLHIMEVVNKFLTESISRKKLLLKTLTDLKNLERLDSQMAALKSLSESDWTANYSLWEDFNEIYEALVESLRKITTESNHKNNDLPEAWALLTQITSSDFIVGFQVVRNVLSFTTDLSMLLHSSLLYVGTVYSETSVEVIHSLDAAQTQSAYLFQQVFSDIESMCVTAGSKLSYPLCVRSAAFNPSLSDLQEYFRDHIFNKFLNCVSKHIHFLFNGMLARPEGLAANALLLIPANLGQLTEEKVESMRGYFGNDLPIPATLPQEINQWKQQWVRAAQNGLPATLRETLSGANKDTYPNIYSILYILALTPVDRHVCRFVTNNKVDSTLDVLQATLTLLHVNHDIPLNFPEIVTMYAMKFPERMYLVNPLSTSD